MSFEKKEDMLFSISSTGKVTTLSRESEWGGLSGKNTKIKNMDDTYILNIISYLPDSWHKGFPHYDLFLYVFKQEAKLRGLKIQPTGTQIPYKNSQGELVKWDSYLQKEVLYT